MRMAMENVEGLMRHSELGGCFVELLSRPSTLWRTFQNWIAALGGHQCSKVSAVALATKPPWGLIRGKKKLGTGEGFSRRAPSSRGPSRSRPRRPPSSIGDGCGQ